MRRKRKGWGRGPGREESGRGKARKGKKRGVGKREKR